MDTASWDTISAASFGLANQQLSARASEQSSPIEACSRPEDPLSFALKARMTELRLEKGAGRLLHLRVVLDGTVQLDKGPPEELDGVALDLEVDLALMPARDVPDAQYLELVFDEPDLEEPVKSGVVASGGDELAPNTKIFLPFIVAKYFSKNAARLGYHLATLNPAKPGQSGWLSPVSSAFTVVKNVDKGGEYLSILSVTDSRQIADDSRSVELHCTSDDEMLFAVSKKLFLQHIVLPELARSLSVPEASFKIGSTGGEVVNSAAISLEKVKVGAAWYQPELKDFKAECQGNQLIVTAFGGDCVVGPGITLKFNLKEQAVFRFSYDAASGTIGFQRDGPLQIAHSLDRAWYSRLIGPAAVALTLPWLLLIMPALAALAPLTEKVIEEIVTAVVSGAVSNGLAQNFSAKLDAVSELNKIPEFYHWGVSDTFKIVGVSLNEALILSGRSE